MIIPTGTHQKPARIKPATRLIAAKIPFGAPNMDIPTRTTSIESTSSGFPASGLSRFIYRVGHIHILRI